MRPSVVHPAPYCLPHLDLSLHCRLSQKCVQYSSVTRYTNSIYICINTVQRMVTQFTIINRIVLSLSYHSILLLPIPTSSVPISKCKKLTNPARSAIYQLLHYTPSYIHNPSPLLLYLALSVEKINHY